VVKNNGTKFEIVTDRVCDMKHHKALATSHRSISLAITYTEAKERIPKDQYPPRLPIAVSLLSPPYFLIFTPS
jgi:hypothetical protein